MFDLRYLRPVRNLWRIYAADTTPHQLALGVSMGLLVGLLPKGNLTAVTASVALFGLRANLGTGLTTAFLVWLASQHLDPFTHGLGVRLLQTPAIYRLLAWAYQLPLVPWTSLDNSVVLGSLVLGCALMYPAYHISRCTAQWLIPVIRRWRHRQTLVAAPLSGSDG
jgi:uncharacterized protein (TIGR03546 family)